MDASDRSIASKFVYVVAILALLVACVIGAVPAWHERSLRIQAESRVAAVQAELDVVEQAFEISARELTTIEWCLEESTDPLKCIRWTVEAFDVP